jgi:hypothetical protein
MAIEIVTDGPSNITVVRVDGVETRELEMVSDDGDLITWRVQLPRQAGAARGLAPRPGSTGHRILAAFTADFSAGGGGFTPYEVASVTVLNYTTCAARIHELGEQGWLTDTGTRGPSPSRSDGARRWKLSQAAIAKLELAPPTNGEQLEIGGT